MWSLEPGLIFLSHGSYGACPQPANRAPQEPHRLLRLSRQLYNSVRERLAAALRAIRD